MAKAIGNHDCDGCGREVTVMENKAGRAYYRCYRCGHHVQSKGEASDKNLRGKMRAFDDEQGEKTQENAGNSNSQPAKKAGWGISAFGG